MNILKKFLRTSYDYLKKCTNEEALEYHYGYCRGLIMSMYATDVVNFDGYERYIIFFNKVYDELLEGLRNNE